MVQSKDIRLPSGSCSARSQKTMAGRESLRACCTAFNPAPTRSQLPHRSSDLLWSAGMAAAGVGQEDDKFTGAGSLVSVSATAALQLVRTTLYQMCLLRPNRINSCCSCLKALQLTPHLKGSRDKWVVGWDSNGCNVLSGPGKLNNSNNHNNYNNISIIAAPCYYFEPPRCPWDASRCNILRGSAEDGGGTSCFQRILAHIAFLHQLDVYARPDASG